MWTCLKSSGGLQATTTSNTAPWNDRRSQCEALPRGDLAIPMGAMVLPLELLDTSGVPTTDNWGGAYSYIHVRKLQQQCISKDISGTENEFMNMHQAIIKLPLFDTVWHCLTRHCLTLRPLQLAFVANEGHPWICGAESAGNPFYSLSKVSNDDLFYC